MKKGSGVSSLLSHSIHLQDMLQLPPKDSLRSSPQHDLVAECGSRKRYGDATAIRVAHVYGALQEMDDVVTISAVARRAGVSRSTVRAILRQEFGWTPEQSRRAHEEGLRRGRMLQQIAGHPGLARGRSTLAIQGWPNLQRAHTALAASNYAALRTQQAATGYPHLAKGRQNLAVRDWPNWKKGRAILAAQDYLPLLEAQRRKQNRQLSATDRRVMRGRSTRLAILEALQMHQRGRLLEMPSDGERCTNEGKQPQMSGRQLANHLHLHPMTVYAHLKQLRALGIIDRQNMLLTADDE